ncbi:hypothetical protein Csp2054_14360 [Curtobacterium sp. 'Ferrero']|uniref:phosphodiester glycosidase family protein n=1 Tax=Curtobacterium sp. 'Ferrero' TaxID=2033654 RepID=UPI000BDB83B6|nr:phosphodiester glycosidase family protein [Curtobacterium sp. 'Ferrero']PCN47022.1 hypothetical protein Csp2054_14360 [Curtobacterium sp. 'Ferrero']
MPLIDTEEPFQFRFRADTTANWELYNPVLGVAEPGVNIETGDVTFGDGSNRWSDRPYHPPVDPTTHLFPPQVLDALLAKISGLYQRVVDWKPPRVSVTHKVAAAGYPYAVTRVQTDGRFIPGLVDKRYGGDFDETNPDSTGTAFIPPGERVDAFARRTGYPIATNASGWNVTSNFGEMRGAQIRNGKIFHDFERTDLSGSPAGIEGLGLLPDGRLKCYSALRGDTAASMVAEGVVHSWSYGPNLVVDGVAQDLTQKNWQYFLTEISARTIIGQSETGDIILISTVGKTNSVGLTGNDMVALAVAEGCYNASTFDGGGSAQMYVQGLYPIPSSDGATGYDGTVGRRKVGDCFLVNGVLATAAVDTGWMPLPLRSGFVAYNPDNPPSIRQLNGQIEMRGSIAPAPVSGSAVPFPTTDSTVADVPPLFRFQGAAKGFELAGNNDNIRKLGIPSDFSMTVIAGAATPLYVTLDEVKWGADTIF